MAKQQDRLMACGVTLSWNVLSASHPEVSHNAQGHDKASPANRLQLRVR
jgi:hypothetical protein